MKCTVIITIVLRKMVNLVRDLSNYLNYWLYYFLNQYDYNVLNKKKLVIIR